MYNHFIISVLVVVVSDSALCGFNDVIDGRNSSCPSGPVVTSQYHGRLGNIIWDYAGIIAVAAILPGYCPYMRRHHKNSIQQLFKGPYLPVLEDISDCSCCRNTDWSKENMGDVTVRTLFEYNKTDNIIIHSPGVMNQPILHKIDLVRRRLQYKDEYVTEVNALMKDLASQFLSGNKLADSVTFVGVHVRRTDFLSAVESREQAGTAFFNFAFDYFRNRKKFGNCLFLVVSDDSTWVKDNLISNDTNKDVFLISGKSKHNPYFDLTLLSLCNHSIYDYGSFGLWGAFYAGGEVITTPTYGKAVPFIRLKNFHFFNVVPDGELLSIDGYFKN